MYVKKASKIFVEGEPKAHLVLFWYYLSIGFFLCYLCLFNHLLLLLSLGASRARSATYTYKKYTQSIWYDTIPVLRIKNKISLHFFFLFFLCFIIAAGHSIDGEIIFSFAAQNNHHKHHCALKERSIWIDANEQAGWM